MHLACHQPKCMRRHAFGLVPGPTRKAETARTHARRRARWEMQRAGAEPWKALKQTGRPYLPRKASDPPPAAGPHAAAPHALMIPDPSRDSGPYPTPYPRLPRASPAPCERARLRDRARCGASHGRTHGYCRRNPGPAACNVPPAIPPRSSVSSALTAPSRTGQGLCALSQRDASRFRPRRYPSLYPSANPSHREAGPAPPAQVPSRSACCGLAMLPPSVPVI